MGRITIGTMVILKEGMYKKRIGWVKDKSETRDTYLVDIGSCKVMIQGDQIEQIPDKYFNNKNNKKIICMKNVEEKCNGVCKGCSYSLRRTPVIKSILNNAGNEVCKYYYNKPLNIDKCIMEIGRDLVIHFVGGSHFTHEQVLEIDKYHNKIIILTTKKEWTIE